MGYRYFTVAEANALLPLLEDRILLLQRLLREGRQHAEASERIRAVGRRADGRLIMQADYRLERQAVRQLLREGRGVVAELEALGCQLRDVETGIVDFPTLLEGRDAMLCWQIGESYVGHYHGVHDGFGDRRPLAPESHSLPAGRRRPR
ncbi:MAG: DUF2203 domain-containing protein [Clostridia bacterium]|nr:DUF2203 domain-containing protein [Clostridia bacterium]MCL6521210.1 DUF2203 domain-containing protein [Bacillota bacterium]